MVLPRRRRCRHDRQVRQRVRHDHQRQHVRRGQAVRCAVAPSLCEQEWRLPNYYVVARANLHSLQPYDMGHIYAFSPTSLETVRMGFNAKAFVFIDKSTRRRVPCALQAARRQAAAAAYAPAPACAARRLSAEASAAGAQVRDARARGGNAGLRVPAVQPHAAHAARRSHRLLRVRRHAHDQGAAYPRHTLRIGCRALTGARAGWCPGGRALRVHSGWGARRLVTGQASAAFQSMPPPERRCRDGVAGTHAVLRAVCPRPSLTGRAARRRSTATTSATAGWA